MPSKKKKIVIIVLSTLGVLIVLAILATLIVAAKVLDREPARFTIQQPDGEIVAQAMEKISEILDLQNKKSGSLTGILKIFQDEKATIKLSSEEVNALLDSALIGRETYDVIGSENPPKDNKIYVHFEKGFFSVLFIKKLNIWTPFGSYINVRASVFPSLNNRHLSLPINYLYLGALKIPNFIIEWQTAKILIDIEKNENVQEIFKIVDEVKVEDETLVLVYHPRELAMFLLKSLNIGKMLGQ